MGESVRSVETIRTYDMSDKEFTLFKDLVYDLVGISLNSTKKMLLVSRLSKRLRALGHTTFMEYYRLLEAQGERGAELGVFINLITTNKTDFFREEHHFHLLEKHVFPELLHRIQAREATNIRIWSAGCSTGEEPYTLAMVVQEFFTKHGPMPDIKILATDVDTGVLEFASMGVYKAERLGGIPQDLLKRYFHPLADGCHEVGKELRSLVKFGHFNLMHRLPFKYGFDVIFCRNVLIYFTPEDRKDLVKRYCAVLRPHGRLALGHSESLVTEGLPLRTVGPTFYELVEGHHA